MEGPQQVLETLDYVYNRTPEALGIAVSIYLGVLPPSAAGDREDVARYAAYVARKLQPRARRLNPPAAPLRMNCASCYLRHHDEDSHFFHAAAGVIGVADGVGGCRAEGVDAAAFLRGLMGSAFSEVAGSELGKRPACPYAILDRAYERTAVSGTPGASTAVIVSLAGRTLRWAYIGDSGFILFRDGKVLRRFQPQHCRFNCPYQLFAGEGSYKVSSDAAVGEIAVEEGDVLVVASDGLFDNVFDSVLERTVQSGAAFSFKPQHMADMMAAQAYSASRNSTRDSPFSLAAREHGRTFTGGKQDDITVVVAFIEVQELTQFLS